MRDYPHAQEDRAIQLVTDIHTHLGSLVSLLRYVMSLLETEQDARTVAEKKLYALQQKHDKLIHVGDHLVAAWRAYSSDDGPYTAVSNAVEAWEDARAPQTSTA